MLYDYLYSLRNIGIVQLYKTGNLSLRLIGFASRIVFNFFINSVERGVFCIILQYIQNKSFFDRLLHGIHMERVPLALGIQSSKKLNGRWFWRCRKCKH